MVGVAQRLERQVVDLNVAGSSPVSHPKKLLGEFKGGEHLIKKAGKCVFGIENNRI
jgi:hypothetical protein